MYIQSIQPIATDVPPIIPIAPVVPAQQPQMLGLHHQAKPDQATAVNTKDRTEEIQKALGELNQAIEPFNISLKFSRDEETGQIVIQMIDDKSGTTLHQFPEEAMLHVAAILSKLQGKIFNQKA